MNIMNELWVVPYTVIVVVTGYDLGYRIGEMINSFRTKRKEAKTEEHHEEPSDATEDFMDRMDSFDKEVFEALKAQKEFYNWRFTQELFEEQELRRMKNDKRRKKRSNRRVRKR